MGRASLIQALAGSLCLALASPPAPFPGAELLLFPGLLLLLGGGLREGRWKLRLWLAGLLFYLWISWSLRHLFFGLPLLLIPPVGALYFVAMGGFWRLWNRRLSPSWLPLGFAGSWALYEWGRGALPFLPYPHAQLGHSLHSWPHLLRPVFWVGEPGVNFLLAWCAGGLWLLLPGRLGASGWRLSRLQLLLPLLLWGAGSLSLPLLEPLGRPLSIGLVQPATPAYPDEPGFPRRREGESLEAFLLRRMEEGMRRLEDLRGGRQDLDLLVYPESASPLDFVEGREEEQGRELRTLSGELGFVIGGARFEILGGEDPDRRNVALLFSPEGRLLGGREKQALVPLGETIPLLSWFLSGEGRFAFNRSVGRLTGGWMPLAMGRPRPLPALPDGRKLGLLICFENCFPGIFAAQAEEGACLFLVVSNENWYRRGIELDQMRALSVFRALETGRPLCRATTDGHTVALDPRGRVLDLLPCGKPGILITEVQPRTGSTPAMGWRPWLPWAFTALLLLPFLLRGKGAGRADPRGLPLSEGPGGGGLGSQAGSPPPGGKP